MLKKHPWLFHWDNDMFWRKQMMAFRIRITFYQKIWVDSLEVYTDIRRYDCSIAATPQFGSAIYTLADADAPDTNRARSFIGSSNIFPLVLWRILTDELEIRDSWLAQIQLNPVMNEQIIALSKELWELQLCWGQNTGKWSDIKWYSNLKAKKFWFRSWSLSLV